MYQCTMIDEPHEGQLHPSSTKFVDSLFGVQVRGDISGDALVWTGRQLDADVPDKDRGTSAEVIVV
jgi:hypothetical protein